MSEEKRVATAEILNTSVHVSVKLNDRYQGPPGPPGKDGNVRFEDLTEAQIEQLRGPQGLTGKTPQITVQVETGEPGTEASVMQSGTAEAPVIALTIPRGNVGATPQITVQVKTGEPGTAASVKQTGTTEAPVIELTIPRGDTGNIGSLTINSKAPDEAGKVTLTAADVGARSDDWMPTAADVGALSGTDATLTEAGKAADAKATGDKLNQLKSEKANKSIISDAWQSGKTYNAGAYCIYNNNLYKALVQTTAEPTSESDWGKCTVTDELNTHQPIIVINNQLDSTKETLIALIADALKNKSGLFSVTGSWTQHPSGYSGTVNTGYYYSGIVMITGTIYAFDGTGFNFLRHEEQGVVITKIFNFTMSV